MNKQIQIKREKSKKKEKEPKELPKSISEEFIGENFVNGIIFLIIPKKKN